MFEYYPNILFELYCFAFVVVLPIFRKAMDDLYRQW